MKRYEVQVSSNSDILDEGETPTSRKEYEKMKEIFRIAGIENK